MKQNNALKDVIDFDYKLVKNDIYGNYELAVSETDQIYGTPEQITREYLEPERSVLMKEREIFFKEALKFLFQLSLMNVGSLVGS